MIRVQDSFGLLSEDSYSGCRLMGHIKSGVMAVGTDGSENYLHYEVLL